jgi:diguanylate cyclase (GGDEF)-like protein
MAASIIIGVIALFVFYKYSKEQVISSNFNTAVHISNEVNMFMSNSMNTITNVAKNKTIIGMEPVRAQHELIELYSMTRAFDGVSLLDENGKLIALMPYDPKIVGLDLSGRQYFQQVMSSKSPFVSEPFTAATGNNVILIASPVFGEDGRIRGVLSGSFHLTKNNRLAAVLGYDIKEQGIIQLISKQGKILFDPRSQLIMKQAEVTPAVRNVMDGKQGSTTLTVDGNDYFASYTTIPQLGWGVIVEYPQNRAFKSAIYLRNLMIIVTVIICFLVFVITYLQSKAITRPLKVLLEGVKRVAEGDYHFNVNVKAHNEIGVLAEAFNSMVERIKTMREDTLHKKEELEKANIELEVMAITDGLTKLYNHRYFQDCLEKAVAIAQQEGNSVTLMILDIDHFKYYNDLFGHQSGDKLLEELSQLLIRELGPNDMVARYGGEEFTIILYGTDNTQSMQIAENLRMAVETFPFPGREQQPEGKLTISIGVASYPENAKTKEELLKLADEALYKAKSCSRNKVELYFSVLDELKQDLDQSEAELVNSTKMLIRIINAKDKYTFGHSERVGRYAVWIAEKIGLPVDEIKTIKIGAFLHDIGKIEIGAEVLTKRGSLTEEEFELIKKHPFWGVGIIKAVESLNHTLPLIMYHHEKFDGTGYPKGLKGIQIPLHARILAVADSFDAMTTNRPYGKRKTTGEAIEELKRCQGTQFDPDIVEAFLDVLQEQNEKVG